MSIYNGTKFPCQQLSSSGLRNQPRSLLLIRRDIVTSAAIKSTLSRIQVQITCTTKNSGDFSFTGTQRALLALRKRTCALVIHSQKTFLLPRSQHGVCCDTTLLGTHTHTCTHPSTPRHCPQTCQLTPCTFGIS